MKIKRMLYLIMAILCCLAMSATAFTIEDIIVAPSPSTRSSAFEFEFTPPYANCMNRYNGSITATSNPRVCVYYFLDQYGNGIAEDDSDQYQDTAFILIDYDELEAGNLVYASNIVYSGRTTYNTKYFTYKSGFGAGYQTEACLGGYPRYQTFTAYGVNGYWNG